MRNGRSPRPAVAAPPGRAAGLQTALHAGLAGLALLALLLLLPRCVAAHASGDERLRVIEERLAQEPESARLHLSLSRVLAELGRVEEARAAWERAEALGADGDRLLFLRAELSLIEGDPSAAERLTRELLGRRPDHLDGLRLRSRALERLGRGEEAAAALRRAVALSPPGRADDSMDLARLYRRLGRIEEALLAAEEGLKRRPAATALGAVAAELEAELGHSLAAADRLCRLAADSPLAFRWLVRAGELLEGANRQQDAAEAYGEALAAIAELSPRARRALPVRESETKAREGLRRLERLPPTAGGGLEAVR